MIVDLLQANLKSLLLFLPVLRFLTDIVLRRHPDYRFQRLRNAIKERASRSSYEGIQLILTGFEKAKSRLKANVNFELVMTQYTDLPYNPGL